VWRVDNGDTVVIAFVYDAVIVLFVGYTFIFLFHHVPLKKFEYYSQNS